MIYVDVESVSRGGRVLTQEDLDSEASEIRGMFQIAFDHAVANSPLRKYIDGNADQGPGQGQG